MTVRLLLVTAAPTASTRAGGFPGDEPVADISSVRAVGGLGRVTSALRGPELRCEQTAMALGLSAAVEPALADLDVGSWRGRPLDSVDPGRLREWLTDPAAVPHGGESLTALVARVGAFLDGLPKEPARLVAVTHPAVVRAAVGYVMSAPVRSFWRLDAAPLSQVRLSWNAGVWRLRLGR